MIVFEHIDEELKIWNKRRGKTQLKALILLKHSKSTPQAKLNEKWDFQNLAFGRYPFLNLKGIYNRDNQILPFVSIQTIGLIKLEENGFKLRSIAYNDSICIDLVFKNLQILEEKESKFYAQIFGFCKFYEDKMKLAPIHPADCSKMLCVEFTVEYYVTLTSFDTANRMQKVLDDVTTLVNKKGLLTKL